MRTEGVHDNRNIWFITHTEYYTSSTTNRATEKWVDRLGCEWQNDPLWLGAVKQSNYKVCTSLAALYIRKCLDGASAEAAEARVFMHRVHKLSIPLSLPVYYRRWRICLGTKFTILIAYTTRLIMCNNTATGTFNWKTTEQQHHRQLPLQQTPETLDAGRQLWGCVGGAVS